METKAAFESAVSDALSRCPHDGVLLAAVSGGADSTAMLLSAAAAREVRGFALHCLHVDHGIRSEGECAADAAAVRDLCRSLDVPFRLAAVARGEILARSRSEGCGIEAAARGYRRAAWTEAAREIGARRVLVGHTADDLLETAVMRFLRGAGPAGLSGLAEERGLVFRPLLKLSRSEVLEYLSIRGIPFRTDSTNSDPAYFRNRVRMLLVPLLDTDFPLWRGSVASLVRTQTDTADFIAEESSRRIAWRGVGGDGASLSTDAENFYSQPDVVRQESIYAAVDRVLEGTRRSAVGLAADDLKRREPIPRRAAVRLFATGSTRAVDLGAARAERTGGRIVVSIRAETARETGFAVVVSAAGTYRAGPFAIAASLSSPGDACFAARLPLAFRKARAEDRILSGGRTVPAIRAAFPSREGMPIAVAEDSGGIAAVVSADVEGTVRVRKRDERKDRPDYAESVFFSILLQRGYHA